MASSDREVVRKRLIPLMVADKTEENLKMLESLVLRLVQSGSDDALNFITAAENKGTQPTNCVLTKHIAGLPEINGRKRRIDVVSHNLFINNNLDFYQLKSCCPATSKDPEKKCFNPAHMCARNLTPPNPADGPTRQAPVAPPKPWVSVKGFLMLLALISILVLVVAGFKSICPLFKTDQKSAPPKNYLN